MPAESALPFAAPSSTPLVAESLDRAIALVRSQLDALSDRRRRDSALTDGWQGGHRARFEDALAEAERLARRLDETLARLALASRRALDEAGR